MTAVVAPPTRQLRELFENCSVGVLVLDAGCRVRLANRAAVALGGDGGPDAPAGGRTIAGLEIDVPVDDVLARLRAGEVVENVTGTAGQRPDVRAVTVNVSGVVDDDRVVRSYWVIRPNLDGHLPLPERSAAGGTDASAWVDGLGRHDVRVADGLSEEEIATLLQEFFDIAPVAIHLIGTDGSVNYANPADVALTRFTDTPQRYIGQHIRQIYADQDVVNDFMNRWYDDSPIINFRANFVRTDGAQEPVVIYSTASHSSEGTLENTRCFVFRDPDPSVERDHIGSFGWPSA